MCGAVCGRHRRALFGVGRKRNRVEPRAQARNVVGGESVGLPPECELPERLGDTAVYVGRLGARECLGRAVAVRMKALPDR